MKQPHTEKSIRHTDDQQNTGNHKQPDSKESGGADRFGGTRTGAGNVEHGQPPQDDVERGGTRQASAGIEQAGGEGGVEHASEPAAEGHLHEIGAGRDDRSLT